MAGVRKIPERRCIGCGERFPKAQLIRVVRSPEGEVHLDFSGKAPGRGAYVCTDPACLRRAQKAGSLSRAFDAPVPPEVYDALARAAEEAQHG